MLQPPSCGMGKLSEVPPGIGPLPLGGRVSTNRQGVTATNCKAAGSPPPSTDTVESPTFET
jgi:hypothetical protein